ncbi:DegT/DnrJ/EryC1/StrS family aminotransferase [Clostridium boliviensis]|uniref:DegT/DnrJ/EryC1/StrS family aminotransferase n=1 Tax=Clostridium boliviensis TaxID=318465 RepID=A0ABU4GTY0_9CLOT|nr:DegT/DnrJ/EryC1/StrS family aminotransferase [Clostridium boliviensis]MDW2799677.1 DegT/DnrJ/EryC1/StrS family aminotransferase [Clostridium boliviensis]
MNIPYYNLKRINDTVNDEVEKRIKQVIEDCDFILGKQVKEFEEEFAKFTGVKHCIGVDNGLDALHIILEALDLPKDSEVIVPSNTFIATALAVSYAGLKLVLVEPDEESMLINPNRIEEKITDKTRVIMPVHLYGTSCEMDDIMEISEKYHLYVIEDNAQAHGCVYKGKMTGSFGIASATSFYPGKNIGAYGDAGAITTDNDELAMKIRMLINYGSGEKYHHEYKGFNARMDEIQAAVLNVKIKYLLDWNEQRKKNVNFYFSHVHNEKIRMPINKEGAVWHIFPVRVDLDKRDDFMNYLENNGITSLIHYPIAIAEQKAYADELNPEDYQIASLLSHQVVSLPIYPFMKTEELQYICNVLNNWK